MKPSVFRVLQLILYALYVPTAWATAITVGDTFVGVPAQAWCMVVVLSGLSGLATLLSRLKDDTPPRLPLYVASHMLGSLLPGLVMFFICEARDWGDLEEVAAITLAAWAGAAVMDKLADGFVRRIAP